MNLFKKKLKIQPKKGNRISYNPHAWFFPFTFFIFILSLSSFSLLAPNHTSFLPSSPCFLICGTIFVSSSLILYRLLPFCFPNPFREKVRLFWPLLGFLYVKDSVFIGSMGSYFSKIAPQFLLSGGD